jgi:hypothetical protein
MQEAMRPMAAAGRGSTGFFHSDEMRVVERFTRQGNEILYEVTVEDPVCSWSRG